MKKLNTTVLRLGLAAILALTACNAAKVATEHAPVAGREQTTPPTAVAGWKPSTGFAPLAAGEADAQIFWQAMHTKADLAEALRHYYRIEGSFPTDPAALFERGALFHVPAGVPEGESPFVTLGPDELPADGRTGIRVIPTVWEIVRTSGDAAPIVLEVRLDNLISMVGKELTNTPVRSASSLQADYASLWAQHPLPGDGEVQQSAEKAANGYLFASSSWEDAQIRLLDVALRTRLTTFIQCRGRMPATWEEVLALTQEVPLGYHIQRELATPLTAETRGVLLGVDKSGLTVRLRRKPAVPAVDTVYLRYRLSMDGEGLERTEAAMSAAEGSQFEPLLAAMLQ